jgi:hypothetical protein
MANKNFVVHNGLTVGALTIDAATGDISTPGNVNITGNLGVSQISKNDSSVSILDTGSGSSVTISIDGTTEHTVDADGVSLASGDRYAIDGTSVLNATTLGSAVVNSSLTSVGNLTSVSVVGTASIYGSAGIVGTVTVGSGSATGVVTSKGSYDLTLTTNDTGASAPKITLVQSDDGNIQLDPSGTGVVTALSHLYVGNGSTEANISSLGAYNLLISTNRDLGRATIKLSAGTNGNIDFGLNGTGTVNIPKITFGGGGTQTKAAIVGGSDTYIQYNNGDDFGGSANLTFNDTTNQITVGGAIVATTDDATALAIALG